MLQAPIPANEDERLESLHAIGLLDTAPEKRFDRITNTCSLIFNVPISTLTLVDAKREWFKSVCGLDETEGDRAVSFCGHALLSEDVFVIPDTTKDERFKDNPMVVGKPFIRFYAGMPIKSLDAERVGVLCVKGLEPREFSKNDENILKALASWAELEINSKNLDMAVGEIRKLSDFQKNILDSSGYSIISTDTDGIVTMFNKGAEKLLGYSADEFIGKQTPAILHMKDEIVRRAEELTKELGVTIEPGFDVFIAKARIKKTVDSHQWTYVKKDGMRFQVILNVAPLTNHDGDITGYMGSAMDISAMKEAEMQSLIEKERMTMLSQRFTFATRAAKIGVWEWDVIQNILKWDDQMYAIYGIKKEQFGGAYDAWQAGLHPDDKKLGDEAITKALNGEKDFDVTFRVIWPDKSVHSIKAYASVERDSQGVPQKMIGVNWDITKESTVDKEKTEFVSLASHQLKTPIGAIQWNMEMVLAGDYGAISDKQKEVLQETYTMSTRMNDLVNALLNISRIEMGVFIIEPKPTDWQKLCEEVIVEMEPRRLKKGHELTKDFGANLPQVSADEKLLRIVFQNFISNAIKYTPDKGKVKVSLKSDGSSITFSVANNGEPIPEAEQVKIFGKMFRASNAQEQDPDGNGLGLYVVKQIVENAGGKIWFTSKKGEDTVFACSIPLTGMIAKAGTKALA